MFGFWKAMAAPVSSTSVGSTNQQVQFTLGASASLANKAEMRDWIHTALAGGARRITLDASATQYMDSSAVGMLLQLSEAARGQGAVLELTHVRSEIHTLLTAMKLDRLVASESSHL